MAGIQEWGETNEAEYTQGIETAMANGDYISAGLAIFLEPVAKGSRNLVTGAASLGRLGTSSEVRGQFADGVSNLWENREQVPGMVVDGVDRWTDQSWDRMLADGYTLTQETLTGANLTKLGKLGTLLRRTDEVVPNKQLIGQADSRPIQIKGSIDELDRALLGVDGQAIIDDPFLGRVRSQLDKYDVTVNYNYADRMNGKFGDTNQYLDGSIDINIYKQNAFTSEQSLGAYVHESSHGVAAARGREIGTLADEYQAFRREFLFNEGRRPTFTERRNLFEGVQRVYDDVPTGDVAPLFNDLLR